MRCPICGKTFSSADPNAALPFCSPRCKQIDLARWMDEAYSIEVVNIDKLEEAIAGVDEDSDESRSE